MAGRFDLQGIEKWFFIPGGYFHLIFDASGVYALYLSVQSPGQLGRVNQRGLEAAIVRSMFQLLAKGHENKLATKLAAWYEADPKQLLTEHKQNIFIPTAAIRCVDLTIHDTEDFSADLIVFLSNGSGPPLRRDRRTYRLESVFAIDAETVVRGLREAIVAPLEVHNP